MLGSRIHPGKEQHRNEKSWKNRVSPGKLNFSQLWRDFMFPLVIKTIALQQLVLRTFYIHSTVAPWSCVMTNSRQQPLEEHANHVNTHVSTGLKPSPQAKQESTQIPTQPCIFFQVHWRVYVFLSRLLYQDTRPSYLPFLPLHRFPVFLYWSFQSILSCPKSLSYNQKQCLDTHSTLFSFMKV